MATTYELDARTIEITHPERVLFPADGITKADLAAYHHAVAPVLVPHLADRPLMLQRFPGGIDKDGFYQKDAGKTLPKWIRTVRARKEGGTVNHPIVDDEAALLALSNLGTVSFHRWGARADELEQPDVLIIDLDPSRDDFAAVVQAARWTRELLDELDLAAYVQVTGSRGLHVVTPLDRARVHRGRPVVRRRAGDRPRRPPSRRADARVLARRRVAIACTSTRPATATPRRPSPRTRCGRGPVPRWRRPSSGTSSTTPTLRADSWTIATIPDRMASAIRPVGRHGPPRPQPPVAQGQAGPPGPRRDLTSVASGGVVEDEAEGAAVAAAHGADAVAHRGRRPARAPIARDDRAS